MEGVGRTLSQRRVCLDTNVVISIVRKLPEHERLLEIVYNREIFLSSVTVFELLLRKTNLDDMKNFVSETYVIGFDEEAAIIASNIEKHLSKKGTPVQWRDIFIAATAIANGCELATLNRKDFENIDGLKLLEL